MNHGMLVICDSELSYANNLMEMIVRRKELALQVRVFSSMEKLSAFSKEQMIDFLLIEEVYPLEKRSEIQAKKVFVITGGTSGIKGEEEILLYKYQSADSIIEQILTTCMEDVETVYIHHNKRKVRLIIVYSPIHRIGKTTFAIALGKEIAKTQSTLYLNLEEYSGLGEVLEGGKYSLADLLYYVKQGHSNVGVRLAAMVRQMESLDYVAPIPVSMDVKATACEEWLMLINKIKEQSIYETIIIDIGESIQGLVQLMKESEIIYMPILEEAIAKAKVGQYEANIRTVGEESILEKSHQLLLPEEEEIRNFVKRLLESEDAS